MITSKSELKEYIKKDMIALYGGNGDIPFMDYCVGFTRPMIWKFEVKLRKVEYWKNCKSNSIMGKIILKIKSNFFKRYGYKLGYTIPINAIGPGLCLTHIGTIVINDNVRIGENARIHVDVVIGNSAPLGKDHTDSNVPIIGDNVYIGPGAKIFGKIEIGNNARIGANSVVNKSVPSNVTVGGIPARIISTKGSCHGLALISDDSYKKE